MKNLTRVLFCLMVMLASHGIYADVAGHVQFVNGVVQLTTVAAQTRVLQKGDAVNEGDTLSSALAASAQIKMLDGGLISLRPDSRLKIDSYKFNGKQDGSEQGFFSLFKGGFRAVTGLIGQLNKNNYRIVTPAATIGIRGTDHETLVVAPGSVLAGLAPVGTYNKVNTGETSMTNDKGTISILPNQMGFVGAADQKPQLQPLNPNLFAVAAAPQARNAGAVRDSAVVDNSLEDVGTASGYTPPPNVGYSLRPITATFATPNPIVTAGPLPPIITVITF